MSQGRRQISSTVDPAAAEQPVEQGDFDRARQQIRGLVGEIAQLSKRDISVGDYFSEFLNRVIAALSAIGGVVWLVRDDGSLELAYHVNFTATKLASPDSQDNFRRHGLLIQRTVQSREGSIVAPQSGVGDPDQPANATEFLLVLGPVIVEKDIRAVIEVFQRPVTEPSAQRGYLRFLLQMCELAGEFLKNRQFRAFTDRQALWNQLEQFTKAAHTTLDSRETAYTLANEGRRLIECDRVSVAVRRGRKCKIEAISGQDLFDKRSNVVTLLSKLANAVVKNGEPLWYAGDTENLAPQVERAVQEYVDESHSKNVVVIPLRSPGRPKTSVEDPDPEPGPSFGALIVEQIEDASLRDGAQQRIHVVAEHGSTALGNCLSHQSLFLYPVWKWLGKSRVIVSLRVLPKTLLVLAALIGGIVALCVVPKDFALESPGKLQPVIRRDVFAPQEGVVSEVLIKHGDRVNEGDTIVTLRNTDFDVQIEKLRGDMRSKEEELSSELRAQFEQRSGNRREDRVDHASRSRELEQAIRSLKSQIEIYRQKLMNEEVRSPISGEVITWDVKTKLESRPVQPGQVLLSVAQPEGEWELELQMAEDRMGHITRAVHEAEEENRPLEVTFILATEPKQRFKGTVKEVHRSAEVHGEKGSVVTIKVAFDKSDLKELLRPGAEVTAKVHCGTRSVGYVWFHDLIGFVQSRIFFRLW